MSEKKVYVSLAGLYMSFIVIFGLVHYLFVYFMMIYAFLYVNGVLLVSEIQL